MQKAYLKTNSLPQGATAGVVVGATFVGLAVMFLCITLGLPLWLTVGVFIAMLFIAINSFVYQAEYWFDEQQLEEKLTPKLKITPFIKPQHNFYKWEELDTYLLDSSLTRYYGEKHFLILTFVHPLRKVTISEGNESSEKAAFAAFSNTFKNLVEQSSAPSAPLPQPTESTPLPTPEKATPPQPAAIARKPTIHAKPQKSFYQTLWGKLLASVFIVFAAVLLGINFFPSAFGGIQLSGSSSLKLWAIVLPGTLYLVNRAFFSSKK